MNRLVLSLVAIGVALGSIGVRADDEAPANWEEVFAKEIQANGQAWQYSGLELPAGYTVTITASGTWQINETWDKKVGAAGNSDYKASDAYIKSGVNEGCLLVRVGDSVHAFSKDDEVIRISKPGKIYFCANDVATMDGLTKAALFVKSIPIQPGNDAHGNGYQDNDGVLKVRLVVSKSKKEAEGKKPKTEDK